MLIFADGTALILTYIKGNNVNSWAKQQLDILNQKQQNNPDPNRTPSKTWWTDFENTFKDAFTFTALKEMALAQLEKLTMNHGNIDTYIEARTKPMRVRMQGRPSLMIRKGK